MEVADTKTKRQPGGSSDCLSNPKTFAAINILSLGTDWKDENHREDKRFQDVWFQDTRPFVMRPNRTVPLFP